MKARLRPILIAALLVLSGGFFTLVIEHTIVRPQRPSRARHAAILAQMDSTLRLTPAQRDSIHAIFVHHQSRIDSAWRSINHRMSATMDSVHHELEAVLEPDQMATFREWIRRQHRAHELHQ